MRIGLAYPAITRRLRVSLLFCLALITLPSVCLAESMDAPRSAPNDVACHPSLVPAEFVEINNLDNRFEQRNVYLRKIRLGGHHNAGTNNPPASAHLRPSSPSTRPVITGTIGLFFYFYRASQNGNGSEADHPSPAAL